MALHYAAQTPGLHLSVCCQHVYLGASTRIQVHLVGSWPTIGTPVDYLHNHGFGMQPWVLHHQSGMTSASLTLPVLLIGFWMACKVSFTQDTEQPVVDWFCSSPQRFVNKLRLMHYEQRVTLISIADC